MAKLMKQFGGSKNPTYSAVYFPGRYWYAAMSFVYDYGGQIATTRNGKWVGTLHEPKALSGLTAWRSVARSFSRANKTGDEAHPQQALVFAKGTVGSFVGNGWEWPYALDPKLGNPSLANKIGAYPMPSHTPGKYMPTFLGGSNLAVPVTSKQKALAADWIAAFTNTANMTRMAAGGGVIPNTTSLAQDQRVEADAGPVRRGREVQLVRALDAQLGERRERQRAPEHAQRDPPQPVEDEGARDRGERADHGDPERRLIPAT